MEPGLLLAMIFLACTEPGVWPVAGGGWSREELARFRPGGRVANGGGMGMMILTKPEKA